MNFKSKILYYAILILGVLACIEAGAWAVLRLASDQADPFASEAHLFDAHRNHRLNPEFQFSSDPRSRIHSPDGFRQQNPVPLRKRPGTVRIVVLGTSALYGAGSGAQYPLHRQLYNDETITFALEGLLRARLDADGRGGGVEVINAGVSAYQTFLHLVYLNADLLDYKPDIVVNLDGHNDLYADRPVDHWNGYNYSTSILVDEFNGRSFFIAAFAAVRALAPYSNSFNLLEKILKRYWQFVVMPKGLLHTPKRVLPNMGSFEANVREAARTGYLRDLWQIHKLGEYEGFDHLVFLQPEIVLEKDTALTPADRRLKELTLQFHGLEHARIMERIRPMLSALFRERGIPFYDLAEISPFNKAAEDLYIDYCHMTPAGARLVAGRMAEVLYPVVLQRLGRTAGSGSQQGRP